MPPSFKTLVGHALSQPLETSTVATKKEAQPSERLIAMTPGSDYIIRLHVEDKQEVKGTILQDSEATPISPTESKHAASTTAKSISTTWLRVPTRVSSQRSKTFTAPAITNASASTAQTSISYPKTMSTLVSSAPVEGWTSRAPAQQETHTPTPAPAMGRVNNLPIWPPLLYALVALLAIAVWFSLIVYRINCHGDPPFKNRFSTLKRFFRRGEKEKDSDNTQGNKTNDTKLHPILHNGSRPGNPLPPSSLKTRECNRINTRKGTLRSPSYTPSSANSLSPPQTPRTSSYSEFAPQATTTSSAYNTPTSTPLEQTFPTTPFPPPSTLRHRTHIPPPLTITPYPNPPTNTTNKTTSLDLEDQTPIPTPRFAALRSRSSGNLCADVKGGEEGAKTGLPRIGSSRWVSGVVEGVIEGVVRWTREGGEEGVWLPTNEW